MKTYFPVLALAVVMLSACGGGGGGGSNTASNMPEEQMPAPTDAPPGNLPDGYEQASDENLEATNLIDSNPINSMSRAAFGQAATAKPKFGSVTQSSNVDALGFTTDTVAGTFDGQEVQITVTQGDGGSFTFGTDSPAYFGRDFDLAELRRWSAPTHDSGQNSYHARTGDNGSFHADYIGVAWDSDNVADYVVWGYWLRSDGNPFSPDVEFEIGAFVDAPGIDPDPNSPLDLPDSGTATYTGEAQGIYHHHYGPENIYGEEFINAVEIGQYVQPFELTVDFAQSSITVCGACTAKSRIYGDVVTTAGTAYRTEGIETDYRFEGSATLNPDGTFRSQQVTLINPVKTVTSFEGSMGGIFSRVLDSNGNPQTVTGTTGGKYENALGESGSYVGTFGAVSPP